MSAPVFLLAQAGSHRAGELVELSGTEGRHAVAVKRLTVGERCDLTDGAGVRLQSRVSALTGRDSLTAVVERVTVEPPPQPAVTVVQALPKGEAGELAVTLLTEVGVDRVVPWQAARSVARWQSKAERGQAKWVAASVAAAKQARRARFPELAPLANSPQVTARIVAGVRALVLHEGAELALPAVLAGAERPGEFLLIVGPEGGITPQELAQFTAAGSSAVRLGPTVMRSATAGAFAAAAILSHTRW